MAKARGLGDHQFDPFCIRCPSGSQIICSDDAERKGWHSNTTITLASVLLIQITYDLDQIPRQSLPNLRDSILGLLNAFRDGPRPIRTQLCVCLANLAIQMIEWRDVLQLVGSTLASSGGDCVLEFLRVLPEEVTEGRKINLTVRRAETVPVHRRPLSNLCPKHKNLTLHKHLRKRI